MAVSQYFAGNYEAASRLFERIQQENTNNYLFWYRFGLCGFNTYLEESECKAKKEKNELVEFTKNDGESHNKAEGSLLNNDTVKRYFLQTDKPDKKMAKTMT